MVGHAIEKAHLVCADLNGDEDALIQLLGTAAGDAGDERLQLGAAPEHAVDDFGGEPGFAGVEPGQGAVERVTGGCAAGDGDQDVEGDLAGAMHPLIIGTWTSRKLFCTGLARRSRGTR